MEDNVKTYSHFLNGRTDGQALLALKDVIASGLSAEILETAQVKLFNESTEVLKKRLGFAKIHGLNLLQSYRLIEFPYFNQASDISFYEYKPFPTLYSDKEDGKARKYLHPKGVPSTPYIIPAVWEIKNKVNKPLWITEGVKKVLKLIQHDRPCIGISGVWNFKAGKDSDETDSKYLWQDLEAFRWTGRTVYIGFDADLWINPMVRRALYELAFKLQGLGAAIRFPLWQGAKGIDDFLSLQKEPAKILLDMENHAKELKHFGSQEHHGEIMEALYKTVQGGHSTTTEKNPCFSSGPDIEVKRPGYCKGYQETPADRKQK
jgi:hypothetical protein